MHQFHEIEIEHNKALNNILLNNIFLYNPIEKKGNERSLLLNVLSYYLTGPIGLSFPQTIPQRCRNIPLIHIS